MIPEHLLNSKLITNKEWEEYQQLKKQKKDVVECIKEFLCTEEYIRLDGEAIANNYLQILRMLGK